MISRALHAQLMTLLWRTTVFNLGRTCDAHLLLIQAGIQSGVHQMTRISVALENAGSVLRPFDSYEQVIAPFRGHHSKSFRVVEIKVDFNAFTRTRLTDSELRRWLKRPDDMVLLQCCLVALTLNSNSRFLRVLEPEALRPTSADVVSSVEVRVPCLGGDLGRQKLLDGENGSAQESTDMVVKQATSLFDRHQKSRAFVAICFCVALLWWHWTTTHLVMPFTDQVRP